ncbi:hypothetical protein E2C01_023399 [Portunus trituberculatus]|uniref:Uncharacterized protein n=1 Tax=Portunus trituberculatus TaxID=210409 RepID=A0A5B7E7V8_PORTR|nr:hypothetical protein [Portunus trituberculatus]
MTFASVRRRHQSSVAKHCPLGRCQQDLCRDMRVLVVVVVVVAAVDNTFTDWIDAVCPILRVRTRASRCDEENLLWDASISVPLCPSLPEPVGPWRIPGGEETLGTNCPCIN